MTTPAYTEFNSTLPNGAHNGSVVIGEIVANFLALRDKTLIGDAVKDFLYSQSGGTAEEPQYVFLKNGTLWYRGTPTWSGGGVSSMVWEWSDDSGASYAAVMTVGATIDGSGNCTATSVGGGLLYAWANALRARLKALVTAYNAHAAASVSVHGMPATNPIAAQQYTDVNIDGGAIDGTTIGASSRALGTFLATRETHATPTYNAGGTTTLDWSAGGSHSFTAGSGTATTLAFSNVPGAPICASILLEITNGATAANITYPAAVKWPGGAAGKPTLTNSGVDIIQFFTREGGSTVRGFFASKDSR